MSEELTTRLENGELLPTIVQDIHTKEVLMLAWVNHQAFDATLRSKRATFWSRSRNELWEKAQLPVISKRL